MIAVVTIVGGGLGVADALLDRLDFRQPVDGRELVSAVVLGDFGVL
ncbi:MAG: hypothetical protein ACQET5_15130 [Halobacteriota archaeon]